MEKKTEEIREKHSLTRFQLRTPPPSPDLFSMFSGVEREVIFIFLLAKFFPSEIEKLILSFILPDIATLLKGGISMKKIHCLMDVNQPAHGSLYSHTIDYGNCVYLVLRSSLPIDINLYRSHPLCYFNFFKNVNNRITRVYKKQYSHRSIERKNVFNQSYNQLVGYEVDFIVYNNDLFPFKGRKIKSIT